MVGNDTSSITSDKPKSMGEKLGIPAVVPLKSGKPIGPNSRSNNKLLLPDPQLKILSNIMILK